LNPVGATRLGLLEKNHHEMWSGLFHSMWHPTFSQHKITFLFSLLIASHQLNTFVNMMPPLPASHPPEADHHQAIVDSTG
jgi:hypothetical protein